MTLQTQEFELITPLGEGVLLFSRLDAREALSQVSEFDFEWLSEKDDLDLDQLLGQRVSLRLHLPTEGERYVTGYIVRFAHSGARGRYHAYHAQVRTWPWFLSRTADCRIFQHKAVPDIVKEIFADHGAIAEVRDALTGSYRNREYCVQYRETDLAFVSRLMEEEGIYYYFEHAENKNVLVLADAYSAHSPFDDYAELDYLQNRRGGRDEGEYITAWHYSRQVQPGKTTLRDYDFTKPSVKLEASGSATRSHEQAQHEIYDYPGEFQENADGKHYAQVRLDELQAQHETAQAHSNARGLAVGYLFKLRGHIRRDQNREYLVTAAITHIQTAGFESGVNEETAYRCEITALSSQEDYRPPRITARPKVVGPQTAIVVGPAGDEIYTDKYGRVKVQFHWDRYGSSDENSSCWVRVSHPWAGKNYGFVAIPRIGQEVVIEFLEGDPDQPLITGRVYNAEQMPPYALPDNKTQTGLLTRSSTGGSPANANELRFEDKKGSEQVFLHAEKNQDIEVENDETHWVGHDRKKTIDHDETTHVKNDRTETVDNNETITIGVNRTEKVGANETITIGADRTEKVGGNENITISGDRTENVGGNESVSIGSNAKLTVGGSSTTTITGNATETVSGSETITIAGAATHTYSATLTQTVTGAMTLNVPAGLTINAGAPVTTNAPSSCVETTPMKISFLGFGMEYNGAKMEYTGAGTAMKAVDITVIAGLKIDMAGMTMENEPLKMDNIATKLSSGAIWSSLKALTILT